MTTNKLAAYSREIAPLIRELEKQKDLLKAFVETDDQAQEYSAEIKEQQENLKSWLDEQQESKEILNKIKDLSNDIKEAVKGAAAGTDFKAADIKAFLMARNKDQGVEKVVDKGVVFEKLEEALA